MPVRLHLLLGLSCLLIPACVNMPNVPPLETVPYVDVEQYMGKWYEIASYPTFFNSRCTATTAEYTLQADGTVKVVNTCRLDDPSGPVNRIEGTARVVNAETNAELEVSFSLFARGDYWIIDLDEDYQWAVVGDPGRLTLFILSRTPTLPDDVYEGILTRVRAKCYNPDSLQRTEQAADDS